MTMLTEWRELGCSLQDDNIEAFAPAFHHCGQTPIACADDYDFHAVWGITMDPIHDWSARGVHRDRWVFSIVSDAMYM